MPLNNPVSEKIEELTFANTLQDTGDLEAGTATIVPTTQPAIASAQYSSSKTVYKHSDARLINRNIASRLNVNITTLGTATLLNYSVRVDIDDADHEIWTGSWNSTGSKLLSQNMNATTKATLFDLLNNGAAHTYYFLFWADVASQVQIDLVELWVTVGYTTNNSYSQDVLEINHVGTISMVGWSQNLGSGTGTGAFAPISTNSSTSFYEIGAGSPFSPPQKVCNRAAFKARVSVATDICYPGIGDPLIIVLRSET